MSFPVQETSWSPGDGKGPQLRVGDSSSPFYTWDSHSYALRDVEFWGDLFTPIQHTVAGS